MRREEDVTQTMYTAAYSGGVTSQDAARRRDAVTSSPRKVDAVCDAVRAALERIDADRSVPVPVGIPVLSEPGCNGDERAKRIFW